MSGISTPGVGSGIDIGSLVSQLVLAETQPKATRLNNQEARAQAEISAIGTLKSTVADFQSSIAGLSDFSSYQNRIAISSDNSSFNASATSDAEEGLYNIEVTTLAASQALASSSFPSADDVVGTGKITILFGEYDSATNGFALNSATSKLDITIDSSSNTLRGIRDKINQADGDVRASIINDGSGDKLVLNSDKTGLKNALKIIVNDDDGSHTNTLGLSQLAYDPSLTASNGKNLTQTVPAANAVLKVDGLTVTRDTNNIADMIEGVTLDLKKAEVGKNVTLNIELDKTSVSSKISSFISNYNSMVSLFNNLGGFNPDSNQGGILQGDFTLRSIENQTRRLVTGSTINTSSPFNSLASIGVKTDNEGLLSLDTTVLNNALDTNFDGIGLLFANGATTTDSLIKFSSSNSSTESGTYAVELSEYTAPTAAIAATQGFLSNSANSTLIVDANNDAFTISIDGFSSGSILLTQQTYASGLDLAKEVQSKINSDASLISNGVSVSVSYETDHLVITSNSLGVASSVSIDSIDTNSNTLGLSVASGTNGQNEVASVEGSVAGTINSSSASTSGVILTGTGNALGLSLEVTGGAIGARGTVTYSQGILSDLDAFLESILDSSGSLETRSDLLTDKIEDITDQRAALERRAEELQSRFLKQFTALDTLVSELNTTSSFLTQQLANLPGAAGQKKS